MDIDNIPNIDYRLLASAVKYYEELDFDNINLPWVVDDKFTNETFSGESIKCQLGSMIGSAEQSFLCMFDELSDHNYFSVTPCWRNEPVTDKLHFSYFMKLELFSKGDKVDDFIDCAKHFFSHYIPYRDLDIITTDIGYDIEYNNIELGSYGKRLFNNQLYSYGTGAALPRLSYAMNNIIDYSPNNSLYI